MDVMERFFPPKTNRAWWSSISILYSRAGDSRNRPGTSKRDLHLERRMNGGFLTKLFNIFFSGKMRTPPDTDQPSRSPIFEETALCFSFPPDATARIALCPHIDN